MPGLYGSVRNDSKRIAAWQAHYRKKECSAAKAATVARDKCRKSFTWPPK